MKHTFVICAYKESEYLEECIQSIMNQKTPSEVLMITSTPNSHITNLASKYNVNLIVNEGEGGIVQDWTFGYNQANTPYITIAHQDDVYTPDFSSEAVKRLEASKNPLIAFTDYGELRDGVYIDKNRLLKVKRLMLSPLKLKMFENSKFVRRRILSLGNPICCPSVTFVRDSMPEKIFNVKYRACEDWEAWEHLSKLSGGYVYLDRILMYHRIHEESETSNIIGDNVRTLEDYDMYCKFWPQWIAKILIKFYSKAQDSNELKKA